MWFEPEAAAGELYDEDLPTQLKPHTKAVPRDVVRPMGRKLRELHRTMTAAGFEAEDRVTLFWL